MNAGDLDRRITILRRSGSANAFNEASDTWATLATVWANAAPVSDGERMRAGETLAQMQVRFTVRFSSTTSTVDPRDRLTFDGRTFDINGTKLVGRNAYIEITATARAETP
jgi:SPP1 family predicted phage head-tail adaptor